MNLNVRTQSLGAGVLVGKVSNSMAAWFWPFPKSYSYRDEVSSIPSMAFLQSQTVEKMVEHRFRRGFHGCVLPIHLLGPLQCAMLLPPDPCSAV